MAKNMNPAPRANAGNRAIGNPSSKVLSVVADEAQSDFAAIYVSRRFHLTIPVARVLAELASLGRAFR